MRRLYLLQVSEDTFTNIVDSLRFIGSATFRSWKCCDIPAEGSDIVIYTGFNWGTLFAAFVGNIHKVFFLDNEYVCLVKQKSKVVRIDKEFATTELRYFPPCKMGDVELLGENAPKMILDEISKSPEMKAFN